MSEKTLSVGFLYDKKRITYKNKEYVVLKKLDWVISIGFGDNQCEMTQAICTGKYTNLSATDVTSNKMGLCFKKTNIVDATERYKDAATFKSMRDKMLNGTENYYYLDEDNQIIPITDTAFLLEAELIFSDGYEETLERKTSFKYLLSELRKAIVNQDEQLAEILMLLINNQKIINSNLDDDTIYKLKSNLLVIGDQNSGKTAIFKQIKRIHNIPMVFIDVGLYQSYTIDEVVHSIINKLYQEANNNIELAEKGIIVVDNYGDSLINWDSKIITVIETLLRNISVSFNDTYFNFSKLTVVCLRRNISKDHVPESFEDSCFSYKVFLNSLRDKESMRKMLVESTLSPLFLLKEYLNTLGIDLDYDSELIEFLLEKKSIDAINNYLKQVINHALIENVDGMPKTLVLKDEIGGNHISINK